MKLPIQYSDAEELRKIMFLYDSALKEVNTKIEILNNEFKMAHQYNPIEHVTSRIKSPQSIAKKLRHNNKELTLENIVKYVNDVAGIRIICSFTSDIFRIADLIKNQSDVKVLKIKDYITYPKENGYSSYHMIISVPIYLTKKVVETKVEIQIRTIAMDFWASLEHKIYYKFEGNAPERIQKELKECANIVGFLDKKMLSINEEIKFYNNTFDIEQEEITLEGNIAESFGTVIEEEIEINESKIVISEDVSVNQENQEKLDKLEDEIEKSKKDSKKNKKLVNEKKSEGKFLNFFKIG
jgi:GTP pyrophosphokinase